MPITWPASRRRWAVYPTFRLLALRVRAFVDFLAAEWKTPPWEAAPGMAP